MTGEQILGFLFLAIGGLSIAGAIADWDWFMNARRARAMVSLMGRGRARFFYVVLGLLLAGIGAASLGGWLD
jgi:hypothetical protein